MKFGYGNRKVFVSLQNLSHFLSHEIFLVYRSQPVTPVKNDNSHFFTLSTIDEYLRIIMFTFSLVE